jgi:hypothetical protein
MIERIPITMNNNSVSKFTCKECGCHNLVVTHVWSIQAGPNLERWQEWGPLRENHHWQFEYKEKIEEITDYNEQKGELSKFETRESASGPQEHEIYEKDTNRGSDEFFVNCGNCDREIEFGWSQPDRRGLIFPVEFLDFDRSESWPDPKYLDFWQQKPWSDQWMTIMMTVLMRFKRLQT